MKSPIQTFPAEFSLGKVAKAVCFWKTNNYLSVIVFFRSEYERSQTYKQTFGPQFFPKDLALEITFKLDFKL